MPLNNVMSKISNIVTFVWICEIIGYYSKEVQRAHWTIKATYALNHVLPTNWMFSFFFF